MNDQNALNAESSNVVCIERREVVNQNVNATSSVQRLVQIVLRETRRSKLNYEQLKRVFREVRRLGDIAVPRKRETLIELPTEEQLNRFYEAIKDPVHKLIFRTLEGTGLRVSELCNLEVSRIDFSTQQAFVKQGKGSKDRLILLSSRLCSQLQLHLSGRNNRFLFESIRHDKFSPRQIQRLATRYSNESQVFIHPHLLRHLFATRLAAAGLSEDQRKILCGHSKTSTAQQGYSHLALFHVKGDALKAIEQWEV